MFSSKWSVGVTLKRGHYEGFVRYCASGGLPYLVFSVLEFLGLLCDSYFSVSLIIFL